MSENLYTTPHQHQSHAMTDGERIATLEANERNMVRELRAINGALNRLGMNVASINTSLSEMSGGKKAVLGMFGLIGGFIGVLGTLFGMHTFGKG